MKNVHGRVVTLVAALLAALPGRGEVTGSVVGPGGEFVEHARVVGSAGDATYTDPEGMFRLPSSEAPCSVEVSHPRFLAHSRVVEDAGHILLVLERKAAAPAPDPALFPARRPRAPVTVEPASVAPARLPAEPRTIEAALARLAGVAPDGPGGLHEGIGVRGLAGRRLPAVVAGVPIVPLRDDGATASFVDPALIERVDLFRGPAGVGYGSLGGAVEAHPLQLEDTRVEVGVERAGSEGHAMAGWGMGYATVALAARGSGDGETAGGEDRHDGYFQAAGLVRGHGPLGGFDVDIVLLPSFSRDAGSARAGAATGETEVPVEKHLLAHVSLARDAWSATFYAHPNELETVAGATRVESDALDFGGSLEARRILGGRVAATAGVDLSGRRGVDRREERTAATGRELLDGLDGAREDGAALFGTLRLAAGPLWVQGGGRFAWVRQDDAGAESASAAGLGGFLGVLWPTADGLELALNLGTGQRFPSLHERYGAASTPSGELRGNDALEPERCTTLDAGVRWFGRRLHVEGSLFDSEVRRFIQPVADAEDALTLHNVTHGRIVGAELDASLELAPSWRLAALAHWQRGRDDSGRPLADVAAPRLGLVLATRRERVDATLEAAYRLAKRDPGPGERELGAFTDVSAAAHLEVRRGMLLGIEGTNLLDQDARTEADARAPAGRRRSLGLSFSWRFD